jgi:S1-C subfamily serine protease
MAPQIQHFIRPTSQRPPSLVSVTIVSALVGLATGAAGFSLLKAWYPSDNAFNGSLIGNNTVTIKTDQSLATAVLAIKDQVYGVFQGNAADNGQLSHWYADKDYIGSAVPVTSDGWLMLPAGSQVSLPSEVIVNQKAYAVSEHYTDSLTGLVFIKISLANLHPIQFARVEQMAAGSTLVYQKLTAAGALMFDRVFLTSTDQIDTSTEQSQIHTTETLDSWMTLDTTTVRSEIIFTPDGSLAGVAYGNGRLMKVRFIQNAVDKLLTHSTYSNFGFSYVDLYRLPQSQTADKAPTGALVYASGRSAVSAGSIAQKAGLRAGDIIVLIGGEAVGFNASVMELLTSKKAGETITVKVLRQDKEEELSFQL